MPAGIVWANARQHGPIHQPGAWKPEYRARRAVLADLRRQEKEVEPLFEDVHGHAALAYGPHQQGRWAEALHRGRRIVARAPRGSVLHLRDAIHKAEGDPGLAVSSGRRALGRPAGSPSAFIGSAHPRDGAALCPGCG